MFVSPINEDNVSYKKAWENYTVYHHGKYYTFFGTFSDEFTDATGRPCGLDIAESLDGVRWRFIGRDKAVINGAHAGFGIASIGSKLMYYPTCSGGPSRRSIHFKVYESGNALDWVHCGDQYDSQPDPRWYRARWDEVTVLEERENGETVYYGYISAEVRDDVGTPSVGMVRSVDGVTWETIAPPVIEWGELPAQHMELNFCERIDGRYYLSMSGRMYMDSYGYSVYTFVGDSPRGPFRPDVSMFRLCGTSRRDVTWLAHTLKTPDGFLVAVWLSANQTPNELPSGNFAIGPLKRLACENGHLRLRWWPGNETAKQAVVPLALSRLAWEHPSSGNRTERDSLVAGNDRIEMSATREGAVALLASQFDSRKGFVIEGKMTVWEHRGGIETHQHAAAAGFFLESAPGIGTAMLPDTLGVTRTGELAYATERITDVDLYAHAGKNLAESRSGVFKGTIRFAYEDQVGPFGHASYCGVRHGRSHRFRLVARGSFFELYVDDYYVQTYCMPEPFTGRVGVVVIDGRCMFDEVEAWDIGI